VDQIGQARIHLCKRPLVLQKIVRGDRAHGVELAQADKALRHQLALALRIAAARAQFESSSSFCFC
jgi:hypothetical protein